MSVSGCFLFTKEATHIHNYTHYQPLRAERTQLSRVYDLLDGPGTLTGSRFSRGHIRSTIVPHESRLLLLHIRVIVNAWLINACLLVGAIPSPVTSSRIDRDMEEQAFSPVPSGTKALKNLNDQTTVIPHCLEESLEHRDQVC